MSSQSTASGQRPIFLYGPSSAGKSSIGSILAQNLNLPFVDLDQEIEARSGMSIPEIFTSDGETGFRERERATLRGVLTRGERVIALGGGALTTPENRQLVESMGRVILLSAPAEVLLQRLKSDPVQRPLLAGDAENGLRSLLKKRQAHYNSFPFKIDTSQSSVEKIAWDLQIELGLFHLQAMATPQLSGYDARVQAGALDGLGEMLAARDLRGPVAVVTDENVGELYLAKATAALTNSGFETHGITIPAGEAHKTLDTVAKLWDAFLSEKLERGSTVIGLGGGVVGDLAGFAAATFKRGLPWVAMPTSLLAMVDASLGGKTGADLPQGKNLIGAFYPPWLVLADPQVLSTLPDVERVNGMAEVIKHGVIADPQLLHHDGFGNLQDLEKTIRRAMAVKVRIIETDPYEKGIRAALNFGHTVGHGVELVSGFRVRHGEAVAMGMVAEARMAEQVGLAHSGLADELAVSLISLGLPTQIPPNLDRVAIIKAMKYDKKKDDGIIRFALPAKIGDVRVGIEVKDWERIISDQ